MYGARVDQFVMAHLLKERMPELVSQL